LPKHFSILFGYLGGDAGSVAREYSRLKSTVMRDPNVRVLPYALSLRFVYERLFDHSSDKTKPLHFYNVLLLVAIVMPMAPTWRHRHIHLRAWVFA